MKVFEDKFNCLLKKELLKIDFIKSFDIKTDDKLILSFSDNYSLVIRTYWRILNGNSILSLWADRNLLPNHTAPEKDFRNLPHKDSLLYKRLQDIESKYLNCCVDKIEISNSSDLTIRFNNSLVVQSLINCFCKPYVYYGLYKDSLMIFECTLEDIVEKS